MFADALARLVFVAFTVLATGGAFFVAKTLRGWRAGFLSAFLVGAGLTALGWALARLLSGLPPGG